MKSKEDIGASDFAYRLLMPKDIFFQYAKDYIISKGGKVDAGELVEYLCSVFKVDKVACINRLKMLKVLK